MYDNLPELRVWPADMCFFCIMIQRYMAKIKAYFDELYQEVYSVSPGGQQNGRSAMYERLRFFPQFLFTTWIISIGAALINFITIVFDLQRKINDRKMAFWLHLFDAFEPNELLCSRFNTVQDVRKLTIWLWCLQYAHSFNVGRVLSSKLR